MSSKGDPPQAVVSSSLETGDAARSSGLESTEEDEAISTVNETRLKWKIDLFIMPIMCSISFLGQVGAANIGNAATAGMVNELRLSPTALSNIINFYTVGTIIASFPATLLLGKIGPPYQFSGCMLIWGLLTIGSAYARNYPAIVAYRFFIGIAQSFNQGGNLYLSFWYRYDELATRASLTGAVNSLAGAFNGLIAYGIQRSLGGHNNWLAWRWIFLIEGIIPTAWAVFILLILPTSPYKVKRGFSEAEKQVLVQRSKTSHNSPKNSVKPRLILQLMKDPQIWLLTAIMCGLGACGSSTGYFLPTVMEGLGYSGTQAQLMTAIVYAVQAVAFVVVARLSDMTGKRGVWILAGCFTTAIGYIILLKTMNLAARLIAACLISAGAVSPSIPCFVWIIHSNPGYTYRAAGLAVMGIMVRVTAIAINYAFTDPPLYHYGFKVCLILSLATSILIIAALFYFKWMNQKKRNMSEEEAAVLRELGMDEVGNRHPDFFFTY